ncbi:dienelactone hydrolase family protein [Nocardia sp. CDC159]|uniref:Dienelactone hydrolase family protein n=1 Tax=Nocardia pulmonis TaxID=2951408 RepID=A0A9X2E9C7_9NOCA|nr:MULTISPECIES: dienelactone hydrolase family protein [Nocardia]MCM6776164.1 dienelactone hydrolase family protein [Nocardia pulmonis]MCM6788509.1 dienelactone hydrolase family protein [Nocardia sp. CDC159]
MSASVKSLLSSLSSPGPHRVMRGNLGIAGQPGVVFTPEQGLNLPAVAFGHGWLTGVGNYRRLLEHLASWGFVAAAPDTERGPIPSHLNLATDLLTTLDICTGVRLGEGKISVHPDRLALAGHGMGAGAAVIAATRREVAAVAALFPAPTAPAAESLAPGLETPALIVAGAQDIDSVGSNALPLASAWGGPAVLRTVDKASHNGIVEGRRALAALGAGKHEPRTDRTTRGLLVGYLLYQLLGDKTYKPFADPEAVIPHTEPVDPDAPHEPEPHAPSKRQLLHVVQMLRK